MLLADQLDQVVRRLTVIRRAVRGTAIEEQLLEAVAEIAMVRVTLERPVHDDSDPLGAARGILNALAIVLPLYALLVWKFAL